MARKLKRVGTPVAGLTHAKVLHVPRNARQVVNVRADADLWADGLVPKIPGALVKLHPPADCSDAEADRVAKAFKDGGAVAVVKAPRAPAVATVPQKAKPKVVTSVRQVCHELADASRFSAKIALHASLDEVLTEAGL